MYRSFETPSISRRKTQSCPSAKLTVALSVVGLAVAFFFATRESNVQGSLGGTAPHVSRTNFPKVQPFFATRHLSFSNGKSLTNCLNINRNTRPSAQQEANGNEWAKYRSAAENGCKHGDLESKLKEGYHIVDVRSSEEAKRIRPRGSLNVEFSQIYDDGRLKSLMASNEDFLKNVRRKNLKKDAKLIVACGDGPVSLIACKQLKDAGYKNVLWLEGGLSEVPDGVFVNEGDDVNKGYAGSLGKTRMVLEDIADLSLKAGQKAVSEIEKIDFEEVGHQVQSVGEGLLKEVEKIDLDKVSQTAREASLKAKDATQLAWESLQKLRKDAENQRQANSNTEDAL